MAIRKIFTYPEKILRTRSTPVEVVDDDIRRLVDDMAETMYAAPGVGLAANQVGISKRVAVVDVTHPDGAPKLYVLINPEIVARDGEILWEEGCLSFPGIHVDVERAVRVVVRALGRDGRSFELDADDFLAIALQHEIDHLDGVTLADKVSFLKRKMMVRELMKAREAS
jgi:peptide deformylase